MLKNQKESSDYFDSSFTKTKDSITLNLDILGNIFVKT
jgi:hypothetical protein